MRTRPSQPRVFSSSPGLLLVLILLACFVVPSLALADTSFGTFDGFYERFEHTFHVTIDLSQSDSDGLSGALLITDQAVPWGKRRPTKPVKISGKFDRVSSSLTFETREKVYIDRDVHEVLRVKAARNASNGYVVGEVVRDGCSLFAVAPHGQDEGLADFIRRTITPARARARIESDYAARIRGGYVPIELRPSGGPLLWQPYLTYADRALGRTELEKRRLLASSRTRCRTRGCIA